MAKKNIRNKKREFFNKEEKNISIKMEFEKVISIKDAEIKIYKNKLVDNKMFVRNCEEKNAIIKQENQILLEELDALNKDIYRINRKIGEKLELKDTLLRKSNEQLDKLLNNIEKVNNQYILLQGKLDIKEKENNRLKRRIEVLNRKYLSLSTSKLGKLTLKYWQFKNNNK